MNAQRILCSPALLALAAAVLLAPPHAAATPLYCQIGLSATGGPLPPIEVAFTAHAAGGNGPLTFHWDFGDGDSGTGQDVIHVYDTVGEYPAILTVTDAAAPAQVCRDTAEVYVAIIVDPFCGATADNHWGEVPLEVTLFAYPALVGDPEPWTWSWRFGDGSSSGLQHSTHTYDEPGTYWAVATLHTPLASYDCWPTLRISAIPSEVAGVDPGAQPAVLRLEPARPNPFGVLTTIGFELPRAGRARLVVYDPAGRAVATLVDGERPAGRHAGVWQGRADSGREAPAGLYFARLECQGASRSIRFVRL